MLKPVADAVSSGVGMLFRALNVMFGFVEMFFKYVLDLTQRGMMFQWVVDFALAVGALLFVFLTQTDQVGAGGTAEYTLAEHVARSGIAASSLGLLLVTLSGMLGKLFDTSAMRSIAGDAVVTFSSEYDAYLATFKDGLHSILLVAISLLWGVDGRESRWSFSDENADDSSAVNAYLTAVFVVLLVSKFFSEGRHGEDAREMKTKQEMIGTTRDLPADQQFKHARGSALTVATGLLVYLVVNESGSLGFFEFLAEKQIALSLAIYILVVALERIAGRSEWVYGGAGGLVVTGSVSTLNLIFAGLNLADSKSHEAIVVALGVIFLDAMRVGYGQAVPEIGVVSDTRKVFLRLAQAVIGLLMFRFVSQTAAGDATAIDLAVHGVATAAALIKIVGITYIGKDLYKTSTEHHYRELASTGLLLASAYLWTQEDSTESIVYFVLAIVSRFLDSIMDFLMTGRDALAYITWDKDGEGVDSPTSDNPRTWLTLLGLIASLTMAAMVMHEEFEDIKLGSNVTDASGVETSRPLNKVLSDSMIVAVTFIAVHVAVVLVGLISEIPGAEVVALGALSRSKFVRFAVTTTVLCSLAVALKLMVDADPLSSDGVGSQMVSALVAYIFADVVGRELL